MLLPVTPLYTSNDLNCKYSNNISIKNACNPHFCKLHKVKLTQEQEVWIGRILGAVLAFAFIGLSCLARPFWHFIQNHLL